MIKRSGQSLEREDGGYWKEREGWEKDDQKNWALIRRKGDGRQARVRGLMAHSWGCN